MSLCQSKPWRENANLNKIEVKFSRIRTDASQKSTDSHICNIEPVYIKGLGTTTNQKSNLTQTWTLISLLA